jgi:hypothetical protein
MQYTSMPLVAITFAAASSRAHSPAIMSRQRPSAPAACVLALRRGVSRSGGMLVRRPIPTPYLRIVLPSPRARIRTHPRSWPLVGGTTYGVSLRPAHRGHMRRRRHARTLSLAKTLRTRPPMDALRLARRNAACNAFVTVARYPCGRVRRELCAVVTPPGEQEAHAVLAPGS